MPSLHDGSTGEAANPTPRLQLQFKIYISWLDIEYRQESPWELNFAQAAFMWINSLYLIPLPWYIWSTHEGRRHLLLTFCTGLNSSHSKVSWNKWACLMTLPFTVTGTYGIYPTLNKQPKPAENCPPKPKHKRNHYQTHKPKTPSKQISFLLI